MTTETLKNFFEANFGSYVWVSSNGQGGAGATCVEIKEDMSNFIADLDGWQVTNNTTPAEDFNGLVENIEQYQVLEFASPIGNETIQYLLWDVE